MMSSTTLMLTPHQDNPSESTWRLWRKANEIWSDSRTGTLRQPLGRWLHPVQKQRQQHFAYKYNRGLWIRQNCEENIYQYHKFTPGRGYQSCNTTRPLAHLPSTARPVDVDLNDLDKWQIQPHSSPVNRSIGEISDGINSFLTFVTTLKPWERQYLQHVCLTVEPDRLCTEGLLTLRAVSDGSVLPTGESSFGWVVSTVHGERMATGMGPVSGSQPNSYRAEACGMLSLLLFLSRIAEFTSTTGQWEGVIATDSESLLNTLSGTKRMRIGDVEDPSEHNGTDVIIDPMAPQWDVLIEIQAARKKYPGIILEYVKGHQDRTKPVATLPLLAQLNIQADHMASKYHELHLPRVQHALMSPRARVHLVGTEGTITSRQEEVIRLAWGKPPLLKWMRERHNWSEQITEQINWGAHGKALKKSSKQRHHLIKLVHDILPTTAQQNKYDGGRRTCPLCSCPNEDVDHILRCNHPSRIAWRKTFLEAIKDFCVESKTHHDIQQLLLQVLEQWIVAEDVTVNNDAYSEEIQHISEKQQTIGWNQLLRGRFGNGWCEFQAQHYQRLYHGRRSTSARWTGERWQVSLITTIWEQWQQLWTSRNQNLHGRDALGQRTAERRELRRQLERIYSQRSLMEPRVQNLLLDNVEAHEEAPHYVTKNWLKINQAIFQASVRRVKTLALRGVRSIRTYFSTVVDQHENQPVQDTGT